MVQGQAIDVAVGRVGPFVPAGIRFAPAVARPTPVPVATVQEEVVMTVPASIPPYRPLRPTPIVTPAIRTPLYIPPIPTPAAEAAIADEGVIDPVLVDTSEYAVPASLGTASAEAGGAGVDVPTEPVAAEAMEQMPAPDELPWIDAFLASTPPLPMAAVPTPIAPLAALDADVVTEAPTEMAAEELPDLAAMAAVDGMSDVIAESITEVDAVVEWSVEEVAAEPSSQPADELVLEAPANDEPANDEPSGHAVASSDAPNDEWPLEEAAVEFRALGEQLDTQPGAPATSVPPMTPWTDDDLMDIMPIRHSGRTPLSNAAVPGDGELWAERARRAQEEAQVFRAMAASETHEPREAAAAGAPEATAEEAAHALELLAQRVRAGELMLPSYDPRMGESAALVAALAALLGVKPR